METGLRSMPGVEADTWLQAQGLAFVLPGHAASPERERAATVAHARNLRTVLHFSRLFAEDGVRHAVLKGPMLQEDLYGDERLRPYTDLDLLVDARASSAARRILIRDGWRLTGSSLARALHFHDVLRREDGAGPPLELHRSLVDRANLYRIPDREVLDRRVAVPVPGGSLPGLAPEDQILYLCLHAAKHGFLNETAMALGLGDDWYLNPRSGNRLVWLLDLALAIEKHGPQLPWDEAAARVRAWNVKSPVAATLTVLARLLPASRAAEALRRLDLDAWRPRAARGAMCRLARRVTQPASAALRTNPRWTVRPARLAQASDLFFPSREELTAFYGGDRALVLRRALHPLAMAKRLCGGS